jgi:hypothetical protein
MENAVRAFTQKRPQELDTSSLQEGIRQRPLLFISLSASATFHGMMDGQAIRWQNEMAIQAFAHSIFDNRSKRAQPLNLQGRVSEGSRVSDRHFDNGNGLAGLQPASGMAFTNLIMTTKVRLIGVKTERWQNRDHLFGRVGEVMRQAAVTVLPWQTFASSLGIWCQP